MQPITLLGVLLCFGVLYLRYRSQPRNTPRRTGRQKIKTAKLLAGALLAWMAIGFALQRLNANLDGADPKASLMERVVQFLSN
jgi:hypothetical protein